MTRSADFFLIWLPKVLANIFWQSFYGPNRFLAFVFCSSNEIRQLMFSTHIATTLPDKLCPAPVPLPCQAGSGHSLNCFRCAASAVCGSNWQLAIDEDKTLIYQAVNLRANISDEVHAAIGDAARRSNPRGVHKSRDRMRGGHAAGISINRTLNGLTCRRRLLIQSYPTSFRLRLLNKFACIMSTK